MIHMIYKRNLILIFLLFLLAGLCIGQTPASKTYAATKTGYATTSDLNMRKKASSSSKVLKKFDKGDTMTVVSTKGKWYKVTSGSKTGYVYAKYVSFTKVKKTTGSQVVSYAKKFLGNPYRYGGTSLTKGTDCSGFTQSIYKHFGYSIPRTSSSQRSAGSKVSSLSKAKAGDLICYYGHVALYMGNNKIIHASSVKTGIKISTNAKYRKIASIRRIL
ncbi:MAG: C40 family peptidase [Lachnospiraceae bacterium]|nr:C40 family peptidase [Lachnospiraceae bacterium]